MALGANEIEKAFGAEYKKKKKKRKETRTFHLSAPLFRDRNDKISKGWNLSIKGPNYSDSTSGEIKASKFFLAALSAVSCGSCMLQTEVFCFFSRRDGAQEGIGSTGGWDGAFCTRCADNAMRRFHPAEANERDEAHRRVLKDI